MSDYRRVPVREGGGTIDYFPDGGYCELEDLIGGWCSPRLSPPVAYKLSKEYFESWDDFKKRLGIARMEKIDDTDKMFMISPPGLLYELEHFVWEVISEYVRELLDENGYSKTDVDAYSEEIASDIDYDIDKIEDALINYFYKEWYRNTSDPDDLGRMIDSTDIGDDNAEITEFLCEYIPTNIDIETPVRKWMSDNAISNKQSSRYRNIASAARKNVLSGKKKLIDLYDFCESEEESRKCAKQDGWSDRQMYLPIERIFQDKFGWDTYVFTEGDSGFIQECMEGFDYLESYSDAILYFGDRNNPTVKAIKKYYWK